MCHIQSKYFTKIMPQYFHCIHAVFSVWYNISSVEIACPDIFMAQIKQNSFWGIPSVSTLSTKSESLPFNIRAFFFLNTLFILHRVNTLISFWCLFYFSLFVLKSPIFIRNKIKELSSGLIKALVYSHEFLYTNIPW